MNDSANDILAQRLGVLEREVRWCKVFGFATVAAIGLLFIIAARPGDRPREIRAQRFTVVDAFDNDVLDIWAAGRRAPTVTLYDQKGRPRTQLDLLPDGTSRLYFADANQRIRLRLGLAREGRAQIQIIDDSGQTAWEAPTR